ncbi:MAG: sigma-70 family RNA polymerase sigma factor [Planctomycetota bacterium]
MSHNRQSSHSTQKVKGFTFLWGSVQNSVRAYINASVRDMHDRDDVLQSTVQYLIEHFSEYDPQRPFIAWAVGIARYRVLDYRQKKSLHGRELGGNALELVTEAFIEHRNDLEPRFDALKQCLQTLNKKQLKMISRKYYDGSSIEVIAKEFEIKPNTLAVMIRRIRLALGKCIDKRIESGAC